MIGPKTVGVMGKLATELLDSETMRIAKAFAKQDESKLTVGISFVLAEGEKGQIDIDCSISYTAEKVKEKITAKVSENQLDLPLGTKISVIRGGE